MPAPSADKNNENGEALLSGVTCSCDIAEVVVETDGARSRLV